MSEICGDLNHVAKRAADLQCKTGQDIAQPVQNVMYSQRIDLLIGVGQTVAEDNAISVVPISVVPLNSMLFQASQELPASLLSRSGTVNEALH